MLFQKKVDRALALLKEKRASLDKKYREDKVDKSAADDYTDKADLESKDLLAMILAALLVFGPILIILAIIFILVL